jgi:DNA gyrase/topoisomerase IV subunit A
MNNMTDRPNFPGTGVTKVIAENMSKLHDLSERFEDMIKNIQSNDSSINDFTEALVLYKNELNDAKYRIIVEILADEQVEKEDRIYQTDVVVTKLKAAAVSISDRIEVIDDILIGR